jgi:photosystem II stability/assembly factor-like uncharacterized protein
MLLAGTYDGVFRADGPQFDDAEQVLDADRVMRVRRFDAWDGAFTAAKSGLYRTTDGGDSWSDLGGEARSASESERGGTTREQLPREEVYSVLGDPAGERLYAGTHPAHLYVSEDAGKTWRELDGFQDLPSREEWHTPRHRNEAHVRALRAHPDAPGRVIAGVEVGGVHVSDDKGETWTERKQGVRASDASAGSSRAKGSDGVHDDIHHVLVIGPDEYVASTGNGLYRTRDAGENWTRLDESLDQRYFREAFVHDDVLYVAAAQSSPETWQGQDGADAALFESPDGGDSFEALDYPGRPEEVVLAWTTHDGEVVAGTNDGRIAVRDVDGWVETGQLPSGVSSLCGVSV